MMMKLNNFFVETFRKEACGVSRHEFVLCFDKTYDRKHTDYGSIIKFFYETLSKIGFLSLVKNVELPPDENQQDGELFELPFDNHDILLNLESEVLKKYANVPLREFDDGTCDQLLFNYDFKYFSKDKQGLLCNGTFNQCSGIVEAGYNNNKDKTIFSIYLDFREELFLYQPWGQGYEYFTLSEEEIVYNISKLKEINSGLIQDGYKIEFYGRGDYPINFLNQIGVIV